MKNDMPSDHKLILITGVMASGKSTVAQMLSEQFEKSVHLRGDLFRRMIVNHPSQVDPRTDNDAWERQLDLRYRLTAKAADTYFEAGYTVIVQDVVIGPKLYDYMNLIQNRPLYVVVLCPKSSVVAEREEARSKKGYGIWTVEALDHILRNETPPIGLWLDSSEWTPEETTLQILARYEQGAVSD